jgi:hypothetical protein
LVYEGWSGAEGNMVQLYINRQHKMEEVFHDYDEKPTYYFGWMSRRYLENINR